MVVYFQHQDMFRTSLFLSALFLLRDDNLLCVFSCRLPDAKERSAKRFSVDGVFNYTSLLLSQEDDMLYVGAREALFALSLSDISKTKLQKNVSMSERQIDCQSPNCNEEVCETNLGNGFIWVNNVLWKCKYSELTTCKMQNLAAYLTPYVICCVRGGDFCLFPHHTPVLCVHFDIKETVLGRINTVPWDPHDLFRVSFSSSADVGHSCWKKRGMQLQREEPGGERHLLPLWKNNENTSAK